MMQKTKDEKFILSVYAAAMAKGDPHAPINRYDVGQSIGLHPKGIDTICQQHLKSNFVKKGEDDDIYLTQNGLELVKRLQE
jgi:hypothetical protein